MVGSLIADYQDCLDANQQWESNRSKYRALYTGIYVYPHHHDVIGEGLGRLLPIRVSNLESAPSSQFGIELPFPVTEIPADAEFLIGSNRT